MPPRYAYWTIIVDDQPTAFRAGALEDIMPTFNRLKDKQPTAKLMWFQSGKLWPSRIDAREAMQMRGERGRDRDPRQARGNVAADRHVASGRNVASGRDVASGFSRSNVGSGRNVASGFSRSKPEWKPKGSGVGGSSGKPEWKPKGSFVPAPRRPAASNREQGERPEWKPKPVPGGRPLTGRQGEGEERPEGKRKWIPKAEYKKATGTEAKRDPSTSSKRDDKWRPGGEHKDPRQKYKDAKKAKWGRFKQAIRTRAAKKRSDK